MATMSKVLRDTTTLSNYNNWNTKHTKAEFAIDFEARKLTGIVTLTLESTTQSESDVIILDSSYLSITDVSINGTKTSNWEVKERIEPYGSPLHINVVGGKPKGENLDIQIKVSTTDQCTALQWLTPAQTKGPHPYIFSQCQAVHARSLFPCQDTPDVKSTYEFEILSALPVVASGIPAPPSETSVDGTKLYKFSQKIPIPSYLFAIASGDIHSARIGKRSHVLTGPATLADAQWEFQEIDKYLEAAEELITPYQWSVYNVLIMPDSFPYGGMENPNYTFATPTLISGDRQNVDVIAHELSHSWSGSLVSCASYSPSHFWLNEGWTMYLERRIGAAVHGEWYFDFSAIIGWKALEDSVKRFGEDHEFTKLIYICKDPDDAFSSVPYEKGFTFLNYIEKLISRSAFDRFIKHFYTAYAGRSLDSYEFKDALVAFFESDAVIAKKLEEIDWDTWLNKPGMPPKPKFDTSVVDKCYALANKWEAASASPSAEKDFTASADDIKGWSGNQIVVFLESLQSLPTPLSASLSEKLGKVYSLTSTRNVELSSRYFGIGLRAKDETVYKPTAKLLGEVGRMKFVRPLFRGLLGADSSLALETFEKNRDFYHPICRKQVERDLGLKEY